MNDEACPHCCGTGRRPARYATCLACDAPLIEAAGRRVIVDGHGQTLFAGELFAACPNSLAPLVLAE